jgi:hypothetical protein
MRIFGSHRSARRVIRAHEKVNKLMDGGMSRPDAFKQVAQELGIKVNSARGRYYSYSQGATGKSRPRTRETTPEAAVEAARSSLERSIEAISKELEVADERAAEAAREAKALRDSADARRQAIEARLEALK